MKLQIIASGSKANCYILSAGANNEDKLILDAGVRFAELQRALDYSYAGVHGCLITHEHGDHSRCFAEVGEAGIEVCASDGTMAACGIHGLRNLWHAREGWHFNTGPFSIYPFAAQHDAAEPLGYAVRYTPTGETFVYATDTYYLNSCFPCAHYYLIECNYVTHRLMEQRINGEIPFALYRRLLTSHMSLESLKNYFTAAPPTGARKIVLCHLSDARSDEAQMVREVGELTGVDTVAARDGMAVKLTKYPF